MRQSRMRLAALTFAVVCGATLTGCSGDDDALPMSASEVEDFVKSSLTDDAEDSVGLDSVECEGGLDEELDDRTSCAVSLWDGVRIDALEVFVVEDDAGELVPDLITADDYDGFPVVGMPGIDLFE